MSVNLEDRKEIRNWIPVSYTHLDVYKRQVRGKRSQKSQGKQNSESQHLCGGWKAGAQAERGYLFKKNCDKKTYLEKYRKRRRWRRRTPHLVPGRFPRRRRPQKVKRKGDNKMKLQYLGHSCFKLEAEGYEVVLDPYELSIIHI